MPQHESALFNSVGAPPRPSRRVAAVVAVIALLVSALAVTAPGPAGASTVTQSTVPSAVPADYTPNIDDGIVYAIAKVGQAIVVGGSFTSVTPNGSTTSVARNHILAFTESTGKVRTFAPNLDGTVEALLPGPTPNTVYVGGSFTTIDGVTSKSLALLDVRTGQPVAGFTVPALNGVVDGMRLSGGHLFVIGSFSTVDNVLHQGIVTLDPNTGALDPYLNVQLTGHHNYDGTGASGRLGGRSMDITKDGTKAIVVGNFKMADGVVHDQIVMLDLGSDSAVVDPNWNTNQFSSACAPARFDTYVSQVDFSPDGSYFAVAATGGGKYTTNIDGTRSLCDSASRFETASTGTDIKATWVEYTGNDSLWSVAATGSAIYFGGHQRWLNNPDALDSAGPGSVPRPGITAVDPANGLPLAWNPGRNPRGIGTYALLPTATGLYVGSDTDYFGNYTYKRAKIGFFPLAGGYTPASTATDQLPANLYQVGPIAGGSPQSLVSRPVDGSDVGPATTLAATGWQSARSAFLAGDSMFFFTTAGRLHSASFDGTTVGTRQIVDPYNDPVWSDVKTGSGETYRGVVPSYYSEIKSVTGAFYSAGRLYYTVAGQADLFWRWFTPDSGTIGQTENTVSGADFSHVQGMTVSGNTIYYADSTDGTLHYLPFVAGVPDGSSDQVLPTTGIDWRARGLLVHK